MMPFVTPIFIQRLAKDLLATHVFLHVSSQVSAIPPIGVSFDNNMECDTIHRPSLDAGKPLHQNDPCLRVHLHKWMPCSGMQNSVCERFLGIQR